MDVRLYLVHTFPIQATSGSNLASAVTFHFPKGLQNRQKGNKYYEIQKIIINLKAADSTFSIDINLLKIFREFSFFYSEYVTPLLVFCYIPTLFRPVIDPCHKNHSYLSDCIRH